MNNAINPLHQPVEELSKQLNLSYGLIGHLNAQLKNVRQRFLQILDDNDMDISDLFSGSRLPITDLEGLEWQHFFFGPKKHMFKAQGEEYFQMADAIIQRESAWTISLGYESFTTFLYDITAMYLARHHGTVERDKLKRLNQFNKKRTGNLQPENISYWRDYVKFLGSSKVFSLLRRIDNNNRLSKVEWRNHREINLTEWFDVASQVRHATVHNNGVINQEKMQQWPQKKKQDVLAPFFPGTNGENGYVLHLTPEHAERALQMFAEYAYVIFGSLSRMHGYEWKMVDEET